MPQRISALRRLADAGYPVGLTVAPIMPVDGWREQYSALLESVRSRISRERAYSPLVRAALGDASVELLSPTEAPGAHGAAAIARRHVASPQREGVGER